MNIFERQVRENLRAILDGDLSPEHVKGATSVRCAIGLILRDLDGLTTLSEDEAWEYLDPANNTLVCELREEFGVAVSERHVCP